MRKVSSKCASKPNAPTRRPVDLDPASVPNCTPERIQFLTEKAAHYMYIFQKNAYVIGPESKKEDVVPIHDEAVAEFNANPTNPSPLNMPKHGDLDGKTEWFALCDEICRMQPTRRQDFYTSLAAYTGMQYILQREVKSMPEGSFLQVLDGSNAIAYVAEDIMNQPPSLQRWSRAPRPPNGG
ncbi:hypothetical protein B0H21DRAFT_756614, partial [Amylocystis lapponica]